MCKNVLCAYSSIKKLKSNEFFQSYDHKCTAMFFYESVYIPNVIEIGKKTFFLDGLTAGTPPSSRSRDTKTRTNIKNLARSNLDIVL